MKKIKSVVVIGGGISGLTAAGLLSQKGYNVKLFEANDKIGGCCAMTEIDGYTFHDGAVYLALPGMLDHVFEKLELDRQSLLPLRKIVSNTTTKLPDGTVISFDEGREVTVRNSARHINMDRIQQELHNMLKKWEPVLHLFTGDLLLHPFSISRMLIKGWRHLPKFRGTVASELNKLFSDEAVRAAMAGVLLYAGLPPDKMPAMSMLALAALFTEGFYLPEGGMGKIPEALSQSLKNNGAEIFLNSAVRRIVIRNGRVYGLEVNGLETVRADAVISTISGMLTYDKLLNKDDCPVKMKNKVLSVPLSHKSMVIQLGLSNKIDTRSHLYNIIPMMDKQHELFMAPEKELKWLVYTVPTFTIPELAPPDGSIIEMYPAINQEKKVAEWTENEKVRVFEMGIQALSQWYDLDIVARRIISPKDFHDRLHLYKGAVYGLSPVADPRSQFRHVSPIPGLYLAGQTTYPGYGVGAAAMSGLFAAEELITRL